MTGLSEPVASGSPEATRRRRRKLACPHCGEFPSPPKRPRRNTSDEEYRASLLRLVNKYGPRIEASGLVTLADAVAVRDALDLVIDAGVEVCRSSQWSASWPEIATATGLSRSAAAERWSRFESARKGGGQPSNLR
jgi:hypothetical protein